MSSMYSAQHLVFKINIPQMKVIRRGRRKMGHVVHGGKERQENTVNTWLPLSVGLANGIKGTGLGNFAVN